MKTIRVSKIAGRVTALAVAALLTSCGPSGLKPATLSSTSKAPGKLSLPLKVDILFAQSDSGATSEGLAGIYLDQVKPMLNDMEAAGWDYHFATTRLKTPVAFDQVVASKHDSNWGGQWLAPYPGAVSNSLFNYLPESLFRTPDSFSRFLTNGDLNYSGGQMEKGFENIYNTLGVNAAAVATANPNRTPFLRPDALLIIIASSVINDTSGDSPTTSVNMCTRSDGLVVPCGESASANQQPDNRASTFEYQRARLATLKASPSMIQFYSVTAPGYTLNGGCRGANSRPGYRYTDMATAFSASAQGPRQFNICSQSFSEIITSIKNSVESTKLSIKTRYLVTSQPPNLSSVKVVRYPDGDKSNPQTLAQSDTNGWTYVGQGDWNVYEIETPTGTVGMNKVSGYGFRLNAPNGASPINDYDTGEVLFQSGFNN
ncbi:MAG: hypothetical protein KA715_06160 [Xanthomonadaceae bacterium]|nr:hypothetical protein [Xanthomonadaceae bacterium]